MRDLTDEEAREYLRACDHLEDFERARDMLFFVFDSRDAFRTAVEELKQHAATDTKGALNQDPRPRRRLQRLAVEFLNAMRLYLDHRRTHLSRRYGKNSVALKAFIDTCRAVHDREPVYRFTYELRNFVQHCGMPLQELRANQRLVFTESGEGIEAEVFVGFNKTELSRLYDDWRHGRAFLDQQTDEFEALPVFERTAALLQEIEASIVRAAIPELWRDGRMVARLLREGTSYTALAIPLAYETTSTDGSSANITFKAPPFSILRSMKFLTMLNEPPGVRFNDQILALDYPPKVV